MSAPNEEMKALIENLWNTTSTHDDVYGNAVTLSYTFRPPSRWFTDTGALKLRAGQRRLVAIAPRSHGMGRRSRQSC
jgi:hypothetical protein